MLRWFQPVKYAIACSVRFAGRLIFLPSLARLIVSLRYLAQVQAVVEPPSGSKRMFTLFGPRTFDMYSLLLGTKNL